MKKILICTGGTGGHIFPALSLAEHLKINFHVDLITDYRAKRFINSTNSKNIHFINIKTPTGRNGLELINSIFLIFLSYASSMNFLILFFKFSKSFLTVWIERYLYKSLKNIFIYTETKQNHNPANS